MAPQLSILPANGVAGAVVGHRARRARRLPGHGKGRRAGPPHAQSMARQLSAGVFEVPSGQQAALLFLGPRTHQGGDRGPPREPE